MTITEFAILVFKSPPDLSDRTPHALFQTLSDWQSTCSGFSLRFSRDDTYPCQVHLLTGWTTVEAHEAWIRGERNQELLRLFEPYVDIPKVRMVHLGVESGEVSSWARLIVERYSGAEAVRVASGGSGGVIWRDLAQDSQDVFRFAEFVDVGVGTMEPVERWVLKGFELL